jgi:hypothetical protein
MKTTLRRVFLGVIAAGSVLKLTSTLDSSFQIFAASLAFFISLFFRSKDLPLFFFAFGTSVVFVLVFVGVPAGGSISDVYMEFILWGVIGSIVGITIGKLALQNDLWRCSRPVHSSPEEDPSPDRSEE